LRRGELYRVYEPAGDPKLYRIFVVVSRQTLVESRFSTVICAPVLSEAEGLSTQVAIGPEEGLKHNSWIICDNLVSLRRTSLTQYIGSLPHAKVVEMNHALKIALGLD
jgi:mRNA interferase MazF